MPDTVLYIHEVNGGIISPYICFTPKFFFFFCPIFKLLTKLGMGVNFIKCLFLASGEFYCLMIYECMFDPLYKLIFFLTQRKDLNNFKVFIYQDKKIDDTLGQMIKWIIILWISLFSFLY